MIDREFFGFTGEADIPNLRSRSAQNRRINELDAAIEGYVGGALRQALQVSIYDALGSRGGWRLERDLDPAKRETLLFVYPQSGLTRRFQYIEPFVRIEAGGRPDRWPASSAIVRPFIADALPAVVTEADVHLEVIDATRTFWEKASILHKVVHLPAERILQRHFSRHYYDIECLSRSPVRAAALADDLLRETVQSHMTTFFPQRNSRWDLFTRGTTLLVPSERRIRELRADYREMRGSMIYGESLDFDELLTALRDLERDMNATAAASDDVEAQR